MAAGDIGRTRDIARNLVEMLSSYEEELMLLEQGAPAVGQLRRAVGMAIAEACYWISDDAVGRDLLPPTDEAHASR
jgi:hypothetical protein